MSYFGAIGNFTEAVKCATLCIEIGERSGMMLTAAGAHGMFARAAILMKDHAKAYDPIFEFALDNGIEPEFTRQMMNFAGYRRKKAYIETLIQSHKCG